MSQKADTFDGYPARSLETAERGLITVWESLANYWDDLVLVGGLAVHYSVAATKVVQANLPGAVTMDVDFGISLGASAGMYGTIGNDLGGLGFKHEEGRLVKMVNGQALFIDFLTEDSNSRGTGREIEGITASLCPGINRALILRRWVEVRGLDLYGSNRVVRVPVAEIGPLLVLKLNAFAGRKHPKDAYDVLLAVTTWADGPEAAVAAFQAEGIAGNRGYEQARQALAEHFVEPNQLGPVRAAQFITDDDHVADSQRMKVIADMVTVGQSLFGI